MKRLIIVSMFGIVAAGCATTSRVDELEQRLARIEGDLYSVNAVTVDSEDSNRKKQRQINPSKAVEGNVVAVRLDAFLREYTGFTFGDDFYKDHPEFIEKKLPSNVPVGIFDMKKRFRWLTKCTVRICVGKVFYIGMWGDCDGQYSENAILGELDKIVEEINQIIGADTHMDVANRWCRFTSDSYARLSFDREKDHVRFHVGFENHKLYKELQKKEAAIGADLPEIPK